MLRANPNFQLFLITQGMKEALMGLRVDVEIDSDVDLVGLEDDDGGPAPGGTDHEEEEA